MGKNKSKAKFNAQRELVSALKTACEPVPSSVSIFSVSAAASRPYGNSNIEEYPLFLVAVRDLQSAEDKSRGLADLWNRAYSLGKRDGQGMDAFDAALRDDEVQEIHDEAWQEGYDEGAASGEKRGFEQGMKAGITKMEEVFVGHVSAGECFAGHSVRQDAAVNTENVSNFCSSSVAVQTSVIEATDASTDYQSVIDGPSFNWANDASSIPIHLTPRLHSHRDISDLRTEGVSKPFSSLQRRQHRQSKRTAKNRPPNPGSHIPFGARFNSKRRFKSEGHTVSAPVFTVTYSVPPATAKLDWDHDPRLMQLSFVLQSLGWSRPR